MDQCFPQQIIFVLKLITLWNFYGHRLIILRVLLFQTIIISGRLGRTAFDVRYQKLSVFLTNLTESNLTLLGADPIKNILE